MLRRIAGQSEKSVPLNLFNISDEMISSGMLRTEACQSECEDFFIISTEDVYISVKIRKYS